MLQIRRLQAFLVASLLLGSTALAHDGDPKLLDKRPAYPGPGWKNRMRRGDDGNLLSIVPSLRFQKSNVTLFSWLTLPDLGQPAGGNANSCYGYTSPSGREYAIIGLYTGTAFVEITQPGNPLIVANLPGPQSLWRDVRTFSTYAYAVSEGGGGIQVFNLANIDSGSVTLANTVNDDVNTPATHTVNIDMVSGYLYRSGGGSNGLRIYNLNPNPAAPARVGTWSAKYSHEVSVFHYTSGPATGKDIAFVCGGDNGGQANTGLYVVDVTNKAAPVQLQYVTYPNAAFAHQCWPSADMQYLYLDDELDSLNQTRVFNISNPLAPTYLSTFTNTSASVDHNQYVKGNLIFQANYRSGLRVKSNSNPGTATVPVEVAYFDTWPEDDDTEFNGLWNNYPYFPSGTVIGSDIEKGLFVWWVGTPQITFTPASDPDTVDPAGQALTVQIGEITPGTLVAGTAKLHYDIGGGWTAVNLVPQGGGTYTASLPSSPCGTIVRYYYSGQSTNGIAWSEPEAAPDIVHQAISGVSLTVAQSDDFQTNQGWVSGAAGDTATAGLWTRVDPNGTDIQTENDHTPGVGTMCWVTGQGSVGGAASSADVDGGKTTLTSPAFDLTGLSNPVVRYWRWYSNDWNSGDIFSGIETAADVFRVSVSNNNGGSWVSVENVGPSGFDSIGGWMFHQFRVADYVVPTAQVKLRFVAEDAGVGSLVEAALDDFQIVDPGCGSIQAICFGDGTGSPCPCANEGVSGHGCDNSSVTGGSILTATGTASVSADSLVLSATGERPTAFSLFLQGDLEVAPLIFGDGLRCTGGNLKRLYALNAVAGAVTAPTGADPAITTRSAALGDTIPSTGTRLYQVYYRDPAVGFCPSATFNVSNALRVVWGP